MLAQQRAVTAQARAGPSSSKHKQAAAIPCRGQSSPRPTSKPCRAAPAVADRILSGMGAAVIATGLALAPMPALAAPQTLADLVRGDFAFVDVNSDGSITRDELVGVSQRVSSDEEMPMPSEEQLNFSYKLFDLNMDGVLTNEELLRAIALDGAVDDEAIDSDVFNVFDSNNDGSIEASEFSNGLGDLGRHGSELKAFVFQRVDQLTGSGGKLDATDFGNALIAARTSILGY